ncbi:DUF6207 family protein [Streptomyces sp. NPDC058157]|uniref:DUF6207 family protein n=1 Tax=Streptomyces sp. NPDC058157 TaxID=3346360 RepID=UPI0036F0C914
MKPIDAQHIAEPGLVVLDTTGRDKTPVRAVVAALEDHWATSGIGPVRRHPDDPGVRARKPAAPLQDREEHNGGGASRRPGSGFTGASARVADRSAAGAGGSLVGRGLQGIDPHAAPVVITGRAHGKGS